MAGKFVEEDFHPQRHAKTALGQQFCWLGRCKCPLPWALAGPLIATAMRHAAIDKDFDLNLLRVFHPTCNQRPTAVRTDAFGFRHFRRFFTDRQVAVVPAFGAGPVTLLAALPFRLGLAWVVELIGAITARLLFRLASELFGLQLAIFAPEILVLLFQGRNASHGISMPALPIPSLLAQFEVFTPQPHSEPRGPGKTLSAQ